MAQTPIYQYPFAQQQLAEQQKRDASQFIVEPQNQHQHQNPPQHPRVQQHQQQHQHRNNSPHRPQQLQQNNRDHSPYTMPQQQPNMISQLQQSPLFPQQQAPSSSQQYYNHTQLNNYHQQPSPNNLQPQRYSPQSHPQPQQYSPQSHLQPQSHPQPQSQLKPQPQYFFPSQPTQNTSNIFTCDHLATFTLPTDAVIVPMDGLERLKAMEQSTGIWKMRVRLTVKACKLRVADINSDTLIEEFPIDVIKDLKCVNNSLSSYKNLIMFTIFDGSINELHMFQCLGNQSGTDFVKEVEGARKLSTLRRDPIQKTPIDDGILPIFPAGLIDPSSKKMMMKNKFQTVRGSIPHETDEPVDAVDRQVKILDFLFSDIESFITQLHQIAYAYQVKAKRKTVRNSGFGDGLQNMRCKQLQAKEFVDIFKEFKLSFILIAKLKKIICNPNAPELVHFLFKPLSLVVNTSPDSNQCSGLDLAKNVANPLITDETINLFENCLDTTENNLWSDMGAAWKKTSKEWHEELPIYVPVFKNGWSPPLEWMKEIFSNAGSPTLPTSKGIFQKRVDKVNSPANSITSSSSSSSGTMSANEKFRKKLLKEKAKVYQACMDYVAKNDKELSLNTGEIIEVLKDKKNWWKLRNSKGESGFAPKNFVKPFE